MMLNDMSIVATQTDTHGKRFTDLGLDAQKLRVTGSIKFDLELPVDIEPKTAKLRRKLGRSRFCLIAASTHPGEEEALLDAQDNAEKEGHGFVLVLAPLVDPLPIPPPSESMLTLIAPSTRAPSWPGLSCPTSHFSNSGTLEVPARPEAPA